MHALVRAAALPAVLAAAAVSPARAQDWTTLPLGTTEDIFAIEQSAFADKWLVGSGGLVRHSDATRTVWTPDTASTTVYLKSVHRSSSAELWVGGHAGTVRFRSFGVWNVRDAPDSTQDYVLAGGGSGVARAFGSAGAIYYSENGGGTWVTETSGVSVALRGGSGSGFGNAWAVGDAGTVLRTTDGGGSWTPETSGTTEDLRCFLEGTMGLLYALGRNGTVLRSSDQGVTWNAMPSGTSADLHAVSYSKANANLMVAVGNGGTVIRSTDAGSSWCPLNAGTSANLYAVEVVNDTEYLVGGAGGLLLHTTTGGGTCGAVPAPLVSEAASAVLSGPFPNPLRSSGHFTLAVDREQMVRVDVFDVTGRRMVRLLDGVMTPGAARPVSAAGDRWPAGVYYVRAVGEDFTASRRFVVVR